MDRETIADVLCPHMVQKDRVYVAADAVLAVLADQAPPGVGLREANGWPSADDLEEAGKAPWHGEQPIEQHARDWKGRQWVPLDAAISELQFWQRRDYQHSLALSSPSVAWLPDGVRETAQFHRAALQQIRQVALGSRGGFAKVIAEIAEAALSTPAPAVGDAPEGRANVERKLWRVEYSYDGSDNAWFEFEGAQSELFQMMAESLSSAPIKTMTLNPRLTLSLAAAPSAPATGGEAEVCVSDDLRARLDPMSDPAPVGEAKLAQRGRIDLARRNGPHADASGSGVREHGLGPYATEIDDDDDGGFMSVFVLVGSIVYLQQADKLIVLSRDNLPRLLAALSPSAQAGGGGA